MNIIKKYRQSQDRNDRLAMEDEARDTFQIREHNLEIWITYNGYLVCPCSMLKDEPIEGLKKMREMYVERNLG